MLIRTSNQHFPITVTKLLVKPDADIQRFQPIFKYTYTSKVTEGDKYGDEEEVDKTFPADFKAEVDGKVVSWHIKEGDVLTRSGIALVNVEEPCTHEELFGNLCVNCGVDVTQLDNYLTSVPNSTRATVNTAHSTTAIKVSQRLANKRSEEATRGLLNARKLSLVVDLDQTVIHATVDPTVAEWQKDPNNPNYDAVKDVKAFQLLDDGPGMRGCWYYIKMRPGLEKFLNDMSEMYELHVYTMGTRAYAQNVVKIIDPDRKIFGDRILSRDESGSMTMKSLQRLFPVDTDMVVIIDDRADVWGWSPNLIKVGQYDFFVGIGDINASFLPKQQAIAKPKSAPKAVTNGSTDEADKENGVTNGDGPPSDLESQLLGMATATSEAEFTAQTESQEEAIATQIEDRPLLKRQEALDRLDEAEEAANAESSETSSEHSQQHRHNLLQDDDNELYYQTQNLTLVHRTFYEEYDQQKKQLASGRVAELRGEKGSPKKPAPIDDLTVVPDIKIIMPSLKRPVLRGVVICFTGVIQQGIDHKKHDLGIWAQSHGARINTNLTKSTTHVVAHKDRRTNKVRQATQHDQIQIVTVMWLLDCFTRWEHVDEGPYIIEFGRENGPQDSLPFDTFDEGITLTPSEEGSDIQELPDDYENEPLSPTFETKNMDWGEADEELAEFMGSDVESDMDFDSDSDVSDASNASDKSGASKSRKRKRAPSSVGDSERNSEAEDVSAPSAENAAGSALQKRRKKASERTTGLANVTLPEKSSGLPSPEATGPDDENDQVNGVDDDEPQDDEDDNDAALEAAMWEEMNSPSDGEEPEI